MQESKKYEFNFDELETIYNALVRDIKIDKEALLKLEITRAEKDEAEGLDESKQGFEELTIEAGIECAKKLKIRINDMIQNFR
jgi:hypothetical protein